MAKGTVGRAGPPAVLPRGPATLPSCLPALYLPPMPLLDTRRQRAVFLILLLGAGLVLALTPYASGIIGGAVLYVLFAPLNIAVLAAVDAQERARQALASSAPAKRQDVRPASPAGSAAG